MASSKMDAAQLDVSMYEIAVNQAGQIGASCPGGQHECLGLELAIADETSAHDKKMIEATEKINRILKEVAEYRKGAHPMLINIGGGALLVWATPKRLEGFAPVQDLAEVRRLLRVKSSTHMDHDLMHSDSKK